MADLEGLVLRRTTTAQQVADALSARILAGGFAPGSRLRESAIAGELGISRNTVREAVRILELGRLVRYEVNRGAVVISPTPEKVDALYTARHRLESAAVSRPVTGRDLTRLQEAFDRLVDVARTQDAREIVPVDLDFHAAIVAMMGSERIDEFFADLTNELRFYLMVLSVADREYEKPEEVVAEHRRILDAIVSGDPTAAVEAVTAHIQVNAARVQEILTAPPRTGHRAASTGH
jgi:DNA-binding GntR family transcriptional regulator